MLKLRVDVDYAYTSRWKSFASTFLRRKPSNGYLLYAKTLAGLINQSNKDVNAYWFFTPYTLPDAEMLSLISSDRHEVALHVINDPFGELSQLAKIANRTISYYSIHGTERLLGQIVWHRPLGVKQAVIPDKFPLKSFHDYSTVSLDSLCYQCSTDEVLRQINLAIAEGKVVAMHPEWLLNRGVINKRGPYVEVLSKILF